MQFPMSFGKWMSQSWVVLLFLHPLFLQLMALNTVHILRIPKFVFLFQTSCKTSRPLDVQKAFQLSHIQNWTCNLVCKPATLLLQLLSLKQRSSLWFFSFLPPTFNLWVLKTLLQNISRVPPLLTSPFPIPCLVQTITSHLDCVNPSLLLPLSFPFSLQHCSWRGRGGGFWKVRPSQLSAPNITKPSSHSIKTKVKVQGNFLNLSPITLSLAHSLWQAGLSRSRY